MGFLFKRDEETNTSDIVIRFPPVKHHLLIKDISQISKRFDFSFRIEIKLDRKRSNEEILISQCLSKYLDDKNDLLYRMGQEIDSIMVWYLSIYFLFNLFVIVFVWTEFHFDVLNNVSFT